jgi:hypothetical protein
MRKYLLAMLLAACGGQAETLGESVQELQADTSFGYADGPGSISYYACADQGTCYYPPGFGSGGIADADYTWSICLDTTNMTSAQGSRVVTAITTVRDHMNANGASVSFVKVNNCTSAQLIHVVKGAVASEGLNPVRSYGRTDCQSSQLLTESPAINGAHRLCFRHRITLDLNDLDAAWGTGQHGYTHVMGALLGMIALGGGLSALPSHDTLWSSAISTGHVKFGWGTLAYCRAEEARYTLHPLFINKQDFPCD